MAYKLWMKSIKSEMLKANNVSSRLPSMNMRQITKALSDTVSVASDFSWDSSDYNDLEGGIYTGADECKNRQSFYSDAVPISSEGDDHFDESDDHSSYQTEEDAAPALPQRPPFSKASAPVYSLQKISSETKDKSDYWSSVHFSGDRGTAAQIINSIGENGVYLIRKSEDGSNVLVFYSKDSPRKFKIIQKVNGQLTLSSTTGPSFQNVEDLLYHYYYNKLPEKILGMRILIDLHHLSYLFTKKKALFTILKVSHLSFMRIFPILCNMQVSVCFHLYI
ncbi:hypothetical protein Btru_044007 [Bulinus truncatus]|nr:hypothetical protein Btru_044007 [Bulinus truncatus]